MVTPRQLHMTALLAAVLTSATAQAQAQAQPPELEIASCVGGTPPLRTAGGAERALLDAVDRARFQTAALARYPLYERGGQGAHHVLMLRHDERWLYVTLQRPDAGAPCFSAVFDAEPFGFTPAWLEKYRPRPGAGAD
jgi:hypothetical protein